VVNSSVTPFLTQAVICSARARSCLSRLPSRASRAPVLPGQEEIAARDERLDLLLLKEVKQGDQIPSKQCRSQPFEPLDAVGNHLFPAREKPAASNVQPEDDDSTKAMTTT
jgi:hypothetical protein